MLIIGHRGAKGLAPENTLRSLQAGMQAGSDMLEVDLRRRQDGAVVLSHDKDASGRYPQAPTLSEALSIVTVPLNLELKEGGLESDVLNAAKNFPHKVLVSSSIVSVLKKVRALDGNASLGLVLPLKKAYLLFLANRLAKRLDLHSIHPKLSLVSSWSVEWLKKSGRKVYAWTVNSAEQLERLRKLEVDGIFTDYPNLLK